MEEVKDIKIYVYSDDLSFTLSGADEEELMNDLDSKNLDTTILVNKLTIEITAPTKPYAGHANIGGTLVLQEELNVVEALNLLFDYIRLY